MILLSFLKHKYKSNREGNKGYIEDREFLFCFILLNFSGFHVPRSKVRVGRKKHNSIFFKKIKRKKEYEAKGPKVNLLRKRREI